MPKSMPQAASAQPPNPAGLKLWFTPLGRVQGRNLYAVDDGDGVLGGVAGNRAHQWCAVPGTNRRIIDAAAESVCLADLPQYRTRESAAQSLTEEGGGA
jgi:hypothetical protein